MDFKTEKWNSLTDYPYDWVFSSLLFPILKNLKLLYTLITATTNSGFYTRHNSVVYLQGSYVFFGGYGTDIIAKLDGKSFKWSKIGKLNTQRKHHGAIIIGDTVFIVGAHQGYGFVVVFS